MKPLLLLSVGIVLASASRADGPINLNNFIDGSLRSINFPTTWESNGYYDGRGVLGATWRAEFIAQDGTPIGDPVPFRSAGRLDFRSPNSPDRIVTGTPGVPQTITVRVWDSATFATSGDAMRALRSGNSGPSGFTAIGETVFSYTIPVGEPPPIGSDRILNFQSFNLTAIMAIPEPGTAALGAAGAVALLWHGLRRKKRNIQTAV